LERLQSKSLQRFSLKDWKQRQKYWKTDGETDRRDFSEQHKYVHAWKNTSMNSHTCSCYMKSQGSKNFVSLFFFFSFLSRKNSFVSSPSGIWSSFICTLKYSVLVVALNLSCLKYVQPAASFFGFQFKLQFLHMVTVNWRIFSSNVFYILPNYTTSLIINFSFWLFIVAMNWCLFHSSLSTFFVVSSTLNVRHTHKKNCWLVSTYPGIVYKHKLANT